jgi:hypothetical protein
MEESDKRPPALESPIKAGPEARFNANRSREIVKARRDARRAGKRFLVFAPFCGLSLFPNSFLTADQAIIDDQRA